MNHFEMTPLVVSCLTLSCGCFRSVMGMATVAKLMSQVMRNKAKVTDPVSSVVYKQFKQASGDVL